jgi:hypothetical protein
MSGVARPCGLLGPAGHRLSIYTGMLERGQILLVTILLGQRGMAELLFAGARSPVTGCSLFAVVMLRILS